MKKILLLLCSLLFSFNLIACSNGSYEEIPEKYINYINKGEAEKFFEEYASNLAKQLYCGTKESDYEKYIFNVEKSSDELLERNNRLN